MVRAAASGAINFAEADPRDLWWHKKLGFILEELHRQSRQHWHAAQQQHWTAFVSHGRLEDESFKQAQQEATQSLNALYLDLFPWQADAQAAQLQAADLVSMWREVYGDPDSPETQAMIDRGIEAMQALQPQTEPDEEW